MPTVFLACVLFIGCAQKYTVVVSNESSHTVSFTLTTGYRSQTLTLEPDKKYFHDPMPVSLGNSIASYEPMSYVFPSKSGDVYTFYDIPVTPTSIHANIYNSLSREVKLFSNGAIDSDPLIIGAGEEKLSVSILKTSPSFSAETTDGGYPDVSYPVQVAYSFDGTTYNIILR